MERLTKRVGCGEAIPVAEGDICAPFIKAGLCKTGVQVPFGHWERHCNDTCVLGMIIDKLAAYEDTGAAPADVAPVVRCKDCKCGKPVRNTLLADKVVNCALYDPMPIMQCDDFCSYGERREGE